MLTRVRFLLGQLRKLLVLELSDGLAKIFWYISKPMSVMNPLCSPPKRLPAPRMSRSRMAMFMPLPSSLNCSMACKRFRDSVGKACNGGANR